MRALAKLPEQRFQSADEMQAALKKCGVSLRDQRSAHFNVRRVVQSIGEKYVSVAHVGPA